VADRQLGKYVLERVIGKGGTGTVYLAYDSFNATPVAIKLIDSEVLSDPEKGPVRRRLFLNEASLVGKLSHPHIVAILDAAVHEPPYYIVMEYVQGGSLADACRDDLRPALADAMEIGFKCCSALDYTGRHGIIHRDIKPGNLMCGEGSDVKIGDFGAAYFRNAEATQVADVGTPAYESPEQVRGEDLTHQSDMFSLGVVLYELLTGMRPFQATNLTELFRQIVEKDPPRPSRVERSLPASLDDMLLRALAKRPQDRYATWADFAMAIAEAGSLSVFHQDIPHSARFQALRRLASLERFSDVELWELAKAGQWRRLQARSVLVAEGEPGSTVFLLAEGDAKVTIQGRLLNVLKQGDCFGEMAYVRGGSAPRQVTVEATSDVLVVEFDAAGIEQVSSACQLRFAQVLLHALSERLALADTRILQLSR
jgi:eukaryotic-like serine/threonine-protein kinase